MQEKKKLINEDLYSISPEINLLGDFNSGT